MIIYIYTLADPEDWSIRYIGKTINPKLRYTNHCNTVTNDYKGNWVLSLRNRGLKPIMEVIDIADEHDYRIWETYWIHQMRCWGFFLTNLSEPGDSSNFCHKETREKISASNRGKKRTDKQRKKQSERAKLLGIRPAIIKSDAYLLRTEDTFRRIGDTLRGKKWTKERKSHLRETYYRKSKLSKVQVIEIYNKCRLGKEYQKDIAMEYGINQSDVSNIANKRRFVDWTKNL